MQAELLSVEKRNIWSAEALVAVESKTNPIAMVRWGWLHVVQELRHVCKFVVGTLGGLYSTPERVGSAKARSTRTNDRNEEVRQPDSSDETTEQGSLGSGGGGRAKRADQGEPQESKHPPDTEPGTGGTVDSKGSFSIC